MTSYKVLKYIETHIYLNNIKRLGMSFLCFSTLFYERNTYHFMDIHIRGTDSAWFVGKGIKAHKTTLFKSVQLQI